MTRTALDVIAQAICVSDLRGPTCVAVEHPEREPCNERNCNRYEQAKAVVEALLKSGRRISYDPDAPASADERETMTDALRAVRTGRED